MNEAGLDCLKCGAVLTPHIPKVVCGGNCRECGRYAYFVEQPSYLYLLTNQQLKSHRVGIGTVGKDKDHLAKLLEAGWLVHGIWHGNDKRKTFQWEKEVFEVIKAKLSLSTSDLSDSMGRWDRSWSESVSAEAISVSEIAKLITKVTSRN